jgi:DNA polymerase-1
VASLDWIAQEIGLAAAFSQDPALLTDFLSGDPHMQFAIRAGLAPTGATKSTHRAVREMIKPISHGVNYGMSAFGAASQTGKSLLWAADMLARHRSVYRVFTQWQHDTLVQAQFDERIVTPLGWPMAVHVQTKRRILMNFPMQAGGGDCMRLAAIAGHEAGIRILAPVHDAFWIAAPLAELDDAVATMSRLMVRCQCRHRRARHPGGGECDRALAAMSRRRAEARRERSSDVDRSPRADSQRCPVPERRA